MRSARRWWSSPARRGHASAPSGLLLHHQARAVDLQLAVFREITCDQAVLTDPATAPREIARCLRSARELSLPVYIEMPRDMVDAATAPVPLLPRRAADPAALAECAEEILARLAKAKSAAIIVDVEIRRYGLEERVAKLARKLALPVVTTFMGRGLLGNASDVLNGTYLGAAGDPAVTRLVERADVLLLLGVILSDTNFALSHRKLDPRGTILAIGRSVRIGAPPLSGPAARGSGRCAQRARPAGSPQGRQARCSDDRLRARPQGG